MESTESGMITVGRSYGYAPETVWAVIFSPELISDFVLAYRTDSPKPGHRFSTRMIPFLGTGITGYAEGEFLQVIPQKVLTYRQWIHGTDIILRSTWTLHPNRGGTELLTVVTGLNSTDRHYIRYRFIVENFFIAILVSIDNILRTQSYPHQDDD